MRYDTIPWTQAPKAPDSPGVLSYLFNHGGLNNQKMALVGLLLSAIRDQQAVNLPYIYNKDQQTEDEAVTSLNTVFDLAGITGFASRNNLTVLSRCPSGERGGWSYFSRFHDFLDHPASPPALNTALDAIASLKPLIAADPHFLALRNFVFADLGIDTVIQLRIETDWNHHVRHTLGRHGAGTEDNGIGFLQILAKVHRTFPNLRRAYATSDEASMPATKQQIRQACRGHFGIDLFWKSDLLTAAFASTLTPLDLSLIDFEIARYSPRFIGLTTSTFSNMLGIEKLAATRKPVRGHFIYNHRGDTVLERQDNGLRSDTAGAMQPAEVYPIL